MQGHRDRTARIAQEILAHVSQQPAEASADRAPPVVLERVNDLTERSFVCTDGAASIDEAGATTARGAALGLNADSTPRWKHAAARVAQRWTQGRDRKPAACAHRTLERTLERAIACGATRSNGDRDEGVADRSKEVGGSHEAVTWRASFSANWISL
jgi:hypothetical protein